MNWEGVTGANGNRPVTDHDVPQGLAFPPGISFRQWSNDSVVRDLRVIDVPQGATGVYYGINIWAYRVENIQNDLLRQYVQWQFQWADANGGGCVDCSVNSQYLISGFEAFKSTGVQFLRFKGVNAIGAMNGSGNFLVEDADLRFTADSVPPEVDRYAANTDQAALNINNNIHLDAYLSQGGIIRNIRMVQEGYLDEGKANIVGIVVNDPNINVQIDGGYYQSPDYVPGAKATGGRGITSTARGTIVRNFTVVGKSPNAGYNSNIYAGNGGINGGGNVADTMYFW
jgi:hypothetical protein